MKNEIVHGSPVRGRSWFGCTKGKIGFGADELSSRIGV